MKRWLIASSSILAGLALWLGAFLWLWSGQLGYKTRWDNMADLEAGILSFNTAFSRLPRSLSEVVESGHLPEKGTQYFCPVLHPLGWEKELSYLECEYELTFERSRVVIRAVRPIGSEVEILEEKVVHSEDRLGG